MRSSAFAWGFLLASAAMVALALYHLGQAMAEPPPSFLDSRYPALAKSQHLREDFTNVVVPLFVGAALAGVAYCMAPEVHPLRRMGWCRYSLAWIATVGVLAAVVGMVANPA